MNTLLGVLFFKLGAGTKKMSSRSAATSSGCIVDPAFSKLVEKIRSKLNHASFTDVSKASELLVEGHTVPFICRYRKEDIGALTPTDLFDLSHRLDKFAAMVKNRDAKLRKLEEDKKLTNLLRKAFMSSTTIDEIDELWAPFKSKHTTNSAKAQSIAGMSQLAEFLVDNGDTISPVTFFNKLQSIKIPMELSATIPTIEAGVQFIVSDMLAHDPDNKRIAREVYTRQFLLESNIVLPKQVPPDSSMLIKEYQLQHVKTSKYRDYHEFSRPLHYLSNHQLLAIRRGSGQGSSSSGDAKKAISGGSANNGSNSKSAPAAALTCKVTIHEQAKTRLEQRLRLKYQLPPLPLTPAAPLQRH